MTNNIKWEVFDKYKDIQKDWDDNDVEYVELEYETLKSLVCSLLSEREEEIKSLIEGLKVPYGDKDGIEYAETFGTNKCISDILLAIKSK